MEIIKKDIHESFENNVAFIDGQNLFLGTTKINEDIGETLEKDSWKVDLERFRFYLKRKYKVKKAYYYIGVKYEDQEKMYTGIRKAGFKVVFRKHNTAMTGKKKGNVDSDIIFNIMKKICNDEIDGKIILVAGDGDYFPMTEFLIGRNKFEKILFPRWNQASSLYKELAHRFFVNLSKKTVREKIEYIKKSKRNEKGALGS